MKHKLLIFSPAGDTAVAEWEETDAASIERAHGAFNQALGEGWVAVTPGVGGAEAVDRFSPALEEIYLLRPIAGG